MNFTDNLSVNDLIQLIVARNNTCENNCCYDYIGWGIGLSGIAIAIFIAIKQQRQSKKLDKQNKQRVKSSINFIISELRVYSDLSNIILTNIDSMEKTVEHIEMDVLKMMNTYKPSLEPIVFQIQKESDYIRSDIEQEDYARIEYVVAQLSHFLKTEQMIIQGIPDSVKSWRAFTVNMLQAIIDLANHLEQKFLKSV